MRRIVPFALSVWLTGCGGETQENGRPLGLLDGGCGDACRDLCQVLRDGGPITAACDPTGGQDMGRCEDQGAENRPWEEQCHDQYNDRRCNCEGNPDCPQGTVCLSANCINPNETCTIDENGVDSCKSRDPNEHCVPTAGMNAGYCAPPCRCPDAPCPSTDYCDTASGHCLTRCGNPGENRRVCEGESRCAPSGRCDWCPKVVCAENNCCNTPQSCADKIQKECNQLCGQCKTHQDCPGANGDAGTEEQCCFLPDGGGLGNCGPRPDAGCPCGQTDDCPEGQCCTNGDAGGVGICEPAPADGFCGCETHADCPDDQCCTSDGRCSYDCPECVTDDDCNAGECCNGGVCGCCASPACCPGQHYEESDCQCVDGSVQSCVYDWDCGQGGCCRLGLCSYDPIVCSDTDSCTCNGWTYLRGARVCNDGWYWLHAVPTPLQVCLPTSVIEGPACWRNRDCSREQVCVHANSAYGLDGFCYPESQLSARDGGAGGDAQCPDAGAGGGNCLVNGCPVGDSGIPSACVCLNGNCQCLIP